MDAERGLRAHGDSERLVSGLTLEDPPMVLPGDGQAQSGDGPPILLLLRPPIHPPLTQGPQEAWRRVTAHYRGNKMSYKAVASKIRRELQDKQCNAVLI